MTKQIAYIGLGSNLGERADNINNALEKLRQIEGLGVVRSSDFIETQPLGGTDQPIYLNSVVEIKTSLTPPQLFEKITEIETSLGRQRTEKWAPRTIDLDILLFENETIDTEQLTIPHPQMHLRSFVLNGLCQLNPQLKHPVLQMTVSELATRLNGGNFFLDADRPQLVSVAGLIGVGKTTLIEKLAEVLKGEKIFEPYDTNPYLADVYDGNKELALKSQLYFLTERAKQLSSETLKAGRLYFSDYVFEKEVIYAGTTLSKQQLTEYLKSYPPNKRKTSEPILVLYLTDSAENCLQRIHKRKRAYEQQIAAEFLEGLGDGYELLFESWLTSPVIRIDKSKFDCNNISDIQWLVGQIEQYILLKK